MVRFYILSALLLLGGKPTILRAAENRLYSTEITAERLARATEQARAENKFMLVAFLGVGWSVSCKKFKEHVLDSVEFTEFVDDHLVYFPVEARRKPKLSSEETAVLQSWVILFDVASYPTLILVAPDGQELLRHGYKDLTGEDYVQLLEEILPGTR